MLLLGVSSGTSAKREIRSGNVGTWPYVGNAEAQQSSLALSSQPRQAYSHSRLPFVTVYFKFLSAFPLSSTILI